MEMARRISKKAPIFGLSLALLIALSLPALATPPSDRNPKDPIELLYGHKRLSFTDVGEPVLTVRLMEGKREISIISQGAARIEGWRMNRSSSLDVPAGSSWTFRLKNGRAAELRHFVQVGEFRIEDRQGLDAARAAWKGRGLEVRIERIGSRYCLPGHSDDGAAQRFIDTRRDLLLLAPAHQTIELAEALQRSIQSAHGLDTAAQIFSTVEKRSQGEIEVMDSAGKVRLVADTLISITPGTDGATTLVRQVEFGVGYAFHNHQDRAFRGELIVATDAAGMLALVNRLPIEAYLRGVVPSEIFARAHPEALKAQAVTARGEVLAKIGTRHLADPYLLCADQHCQVYSGLTGEAASTDKAIADTRGELLFSEDGKLVASAYSAVCGGHTEDNEIVWSALPDPALRGRPDVPKIDQKVSTNSDPGALHTFLSTPPQAFCSQASLASPTKFRWEKRFSRAQMDALTADLGIGPIVALSFSERGASGRARVLTLSGEQGARQIRGELNIRRRFQNLNSTMAEIEAPSGEGQPDWIFRGGGWGHGVGMCQIGAIGRAEAGQSYRDILRHYFNGATPRRVGGK